MNPHEDECGSEPALVLVVQTVSVNELCFNQTVAQTLVSSHCSRQLVS